MKTIFITGHDTGIGKTWITKYIASALTHQKQKVQVIKAVETGINPNNNQENDITKVLKNLNPHYITGFTLNSFQAPLAPLSAAELENKILSFEKLKYQIQNLPQADYRLIEAAGGIAVPLDPSGKDACDLALELKVDYILLGIENRLGAINQARLVLSYIPKEFTNIGLWFNDLTPRDPVLTHSNWVELRRLKAPIWGHHSFTQLEPDFCNAPFLQPFIKNHSLQCQLS